MDKFGRDYWRSFAQLKQGPQNHIPQGCVQTMSTSRGGDSTTPLSDLFNEVLIIPSATLSRRFYFLVHLKLSSVRNSRCPFILSTYALLYLAKIYLPEGICLYLPYLGIFCNFCEERGCFSSSAGPECSSWEWPDSSLLCSHTLMLKSYS